MWLYMRVKLNPGPTSRDPSIAFVMAPQPLVMILFYTSMYYSIVFLLILYRIMLYYIMLYYTELYSIMLRCPKRCVDLPKVRGTKFTMEGCTVDENSAA